MKTVTCLGVSQQCGLPLRVSVTAIEEADIDLEITGPVTQTAVHAITFAIIAARKYIAKTHPISDAGFSLADCGFAVDVHSALPVDGDSLMLGVAIAAAAEMMHIPLPENFAVTGSMTADGDVCGVAGMHEKLASAALEGFEFVLTPPGTQPMVIESVSSLGGALELLSKRIGKEK